MRLNKKEQKVVSEIFDLVKNSECLEGECWNDCLPLLIKEAVNRNVKTNKIETTSKIASLLIYPYNSYKVSK